MQLCRGSAAVESPNGRGDSQPNRGDPYLFDGPGLNGQGDGKRDLLGLALIQADRAVLVVVRRWGLALRFVATGRFVVVVVNTAMGATVRAAGLPKMRHPTACAVDDRMFNSMQSLTTQRVDQIGESAEQYGDLSNDIAHGANFTGAWIFGSGDAQLSPTGEISDFGMYLQT